MFLYFLDQKDTMPGTILSFKRNRLLPAIAVLSVFFLLTGEFFSCCRINEAFASDVRQAIQSLGLMKPLKMASNTSEDPDHHSHCHGHEAPSNAQLDEAVQTGYSMFTQDGSCISELSITKKSMVGSESFALEIPTAYVAIFEGPVLVQTYSVDRPRPQNRSGPPVYLLTLRILV